MKRATQMKSEHTPEEEDEKSFVQPEPKPNSANTKNRSLSTFQGNNVFSHFHFIIADDCLHKK